MALPADLINLATNPTAASTTGYAAVAGTGGTAALTNQVTAGYSGSNFNRTTWTVATTAVSGGQSYTQTGLSAATAYGIGVWVRSSKTQTVNLSVAFQTSVPATVNTITSGNVALVANTWTRLTVTGTSGAAVDRAVLTVAAATGGALWANTDTLDLDAILIITGATVPAYFDGSLSPDSSYRYFWTGTANASTSHAEYRGVWVEQRSGGGAPSAQVTVSGLGTVAGAVQVTRTADGETWTVPGWYNRSVVDTDTDPDFAVPLGRNVTYTVFFNGAQIGQKSITITSPTGWVQSPYDPASAMPINTTLTDPTVLTLAKGSLDSRVHASNSTRVAAMGAKRPYSIAGQRMADAAAAFVFHAWKNATSDQFKTMVGQAPILLIRGLPSWGSIPGLAYIDAPAQELNVTRYKNYPNDGLTQWALGGDLVQPVSRKPLTGTVTNDQVQTNLTGVTYNTILARSGSKKNVDIKANPLGL